jgi:tol-pal system protein YbgF
MKRRLLAALLVLSATAHAGLFDDQEARKNIEQLRTETTDLNSRVETLSRNQLGFSNQVEAIKAELAKLRGQIEVLTYELEAAQKRQKDFYVDLDNRLRKLEQPASDAAKAAPPPGDPAAETRDYEASLGLLKASKFADAASGFVAFIKAWPNSSMLASAHYWGGYAYSQTKEPAKAADLFGKFVASWPDDERAPVALESQIINLEAIKETKAARAALELLASKYPASEAGKKAKWRLKKK